MNGGIDVAVTADESLGRDVLSAREPRARLGRVAVRIKRDGDRGTPRLRIDVRLPLRRARHDERHAARRAERTNLIIGNTMFCEHFARKTLHLTQKVRHRMCGNLFRPDFKQQIFLHAFAPFFSIG